MRIDRVWAMPSKNTFQIKPINEMLNEEITDGLWIDPFANSNKFAEITNDLNPEFDTTYLKTVQLMEYCMTLLFRQDKLVSVIRILAIM